MIKRLLAFVLPFASLAAGAQIEGTEYYLPKTELRFKLLIERTEYTPGEFATYSERFLKKDAPTEKSLSYSIVGIKMHTTAIPDSAKHYFVPIDKKHSIFNVERASNGVLLAINAKGKAVAKVEEYVPAPKKAVPNPRDFMNEDILATGSKAKMAELTAKEIYDIRSSRNELTRGEADYMPKDGEQLRIMLANLNRQESALMQAFLGFEVKDTLQEEVVFCPVGKQEGAEEGEKELLFRFSKYLGMVDNDDLGGAPYYIKVEDMNIIPELKTVLDGEKPQKGDLGIKVNMPGKIKVTLMEGNRAVKAFELYAAQYGSIETLSSNLWGKKFTTHLQLNPITGNVETLETEPLE